MSSIAMEKVAEILRGYPSDGALDRNELVKVTAGAPVALKNGDLVEKQSDGTVDLSGASANKAVGLVIRGPGDSTSALNAMGSLNDVGSTASGTSSQAVVLWGNYIVRTSNYAAGAYAPGSPVTAKSGKFALANGTTDPEVGFVLHVITGATGQTTPANLVICVR
jgi:hypothetical protein